MVSPPISWTPLIEDRLPPFDVIVLLFSFCPVRSVFLRGIGAFAGRFKTCSVLPKGFPVRAWSNTPPCATSLLS